MALEIGAVDIADLPDEDLEPILDVVNVLDGEASQRHVAMDLDDLRMLAVSPGMTQQRYVARDERGEIVAIASWRHPDDGTNADVLICDLRVLPEHRRRGIGTDLLAMLARVANEKGRPKMQGIVFDTVPAGVEFSRAVGAEKKMEFHENVLRIDELDTTLLESWVAQGQARAPGYSVRIVHDVWPEDLLGDIAHLYYVLERDMPVSDSFEPRAWTTERVSALQDHYANGFDTVSAFAIHGETSAAVGMTDMVRRKTDPTTWIVTTTMVDPLHRGKSLGKWLKGAANLAALERWEGGIYQETGNAFTNEAMLSINRAMGFEHEFTILDCYLDAGDALAYATRESQAGGVPGSSTRVPGSKSGSAASAAST